MPVEDNDGSVGSMRCSAEDRRQMAKRSLDYVCPQCGPISKIVKDHIPPATYQSKSTVSKESQIFNFAPEKALKQQTQDRIKKEAEQSVKEELEHIKEEVS